MCMPNMINNALHTFKVTSANQLQIHDTLLVFGIIAGGLLHNLGCCVLALEDTTTQLLLHNPNMAKYHDFS